MCMRVCVCDCICVCNFVSSRERFIEVSNFQNIHVNFKNMLMHNISCGKLDPGPKNHILFTVGKLRFKKK